MTPQEETTEILELLMKIHDPICLKTISYAARDRRKDLLTAETRSWQVGDEVMQRPEHRGRKPFAAKGIIRKINRVKMIIEFGPGSHWTFPPTMLQKI